MELILQQLLTIWAAPAVFLAAGGFLALLVPKFGPAIAAKCFSLAKWWLLWPLKKGWQLAGKYGKKMLNSAGKKLRKALSGLLSRAGRGVRVIGRRAKARLSRRAP